MIYKEKIIMFEKNKDSILMRLIQLIVFVQVWFCVVDKLAIGSFIKKPL
jgi:hypothetical protein